MSIPGSTGWSNETILFDASWRASTDIEHHELVARIAPTDHTVFPDRTFSTQFAVMQALAAQGEVPMATIHWLEQSTEWFDSEFWIMDRIRRRRALRRTALRGRGLAPRRVTGRPGPRLVERHRRHGDGPPAGPRAGWVPR